MSSQIGGQVLGPSGAPLENAEVVLKVVAKGIASRTVTNHSGIFEFPGLDPGKYDLEILSEGLQALRLKGIELLAAQRWHQVFRLQLPTLAQEITVQAQAESLNTVATHGVRGGALTAREASDLPLLQGDRGRLFGNLMFSLGGIYPGRTHAPFLANGNRQIGTLNLMVDSAEFNDALQGTTMGRGTTEQPVPMETVQSFEAQMSSFKAEYGRASAAVVNLITKSGTNEWHGSLYYLWQNSALNARNALLVEKPPLRSNVPGMTLGGPLRRNRLFFFGGYENPVRNTYSGSTTVQTLTEAQRAQAVPRMRPLVDVFPLPNVPGSNLYVTNVPNPQTLKSITGRIDAVLGSRHNVSIRQTFLKSIGYKFTAIPAAARDSSNGNRLSSLNWDAALSPRWHNQARAAYSVYQNPIRLENPFLGDPAQHGLVGVLRVTGLTAIAAFRTNQALTSHNYSASDDITGVFGAHVVKAGLNVRRIHANTAPETNFYGTMVFRSVADFLAGRPLSYSINQGDPRLDLRSTEIGAYFQDDWRVSPGVTLNLGVRYESYSVPADKYGRLRDPYNPDRNNVAPRFGFAWQPGGVGKNVVRGGYGIYYNPLVLNMVGDTRFAPPLVYGYTIASPSLPPNLSAATLSANRTVIERNIRNPFVQNWNLTLERSLLPQAVVSLAWVGTKADHLPRSRLPNGGPTLAQSARPDPRSGVITRYEGSASSVYHSLQVTARGSWSNGAVFRSSYTFGKSIDNASEYGALPISENNLGLDRGVSDFNTRHMFNAHALYPLPWLRDRRWLGGWQLATLVTARSGLPFSILSNTNNLSGVLNNRIMDIPGAILRGGTGRTRLQLAPGVTPALLTPPPGAIGTLGRNTETAPAAIDWNASVMKNFALGERAQMEFRVESFNFLNRVNYDAPVPNIADPQFGYVLTARDPRQFQISLRLRF